MLGRLDPERVEPPRQGGTGLVGSEDPLPGGNKRQRDALQIVAHHTDHPVLALITKRTRLWAKCEIESDETIGEEAWDARVSETNEVTHVLDEQIVDTVATSPAGLIAQVELLVATGERELAARVGEPVDDELADQLLASIIAGIKALAAL